MEFINTWKVCLIIMFIFQTAFITIHLSSAALSNNADENHDDNVEHYPEIMRAPVTIKGLEDEDNSSTFEAYTVNNWTTANKTIVKEQDRHRYYVKNEKEIGKWLSKSHEGTDFEDASHVHQIYNHRSSPSERLYQKEDENEEVNQDGFRNDTRLRVEHGTEVTSYDEEFVTIARLLQERFGKKTSQMKRKLSLQLGHNPLPVQVFTGKRLLTKLLRVPGSENERARKLITNMVVSGMASQGSVNDTKLMKVRDLIDKKLRHLAEQLKYRVNTNNDNITITTTPYTSSSTAVSAASNTTSYVATAAKAKRYIDERVLSAVVITKVRHMMHVIDLSSNEDYSHVFRNGGDVFDLRCRDRLTGVHYQRYMIKLTNYYMIGYFNYYISDYAVLSVGVTNKKTFRYIFALPLTVLANKRIGFGSIVILVSPVDNYINNPSLRHVLSRLCQLGALVIFLPAREKNTASVSQISRIFAANILLNIYDELREKGFDVSRPHDKYLVLSDSDIWPLKRSVFSLPINASILVRPPIMHRPIEEGDRVYNMYPLSGTGMRTTVWHNVLTTYGNIPRDIQVTADNIVQLFIERFGQIANKTTRRSGLEESWFLDQRFLSFVIQNYVDQHGDGGIFILKHWQPRIDKRHWPAADQITQEMVDNAKEVHVIPAENGEKWRQLMPLLEKMYGVYSEEYSWCLDYYDEYTEKSGYLRNQSTTLA